MQAFASLLLSPDLKMEGRPPVVQESMIFYNALACQMIGLATKAGKVASGEFCTEKEVKSGRAYLVIVADDASDNTKKKFQNMCDFYQVPIYFYKDKDTLGHAMGKEFRASLVILDEGFAKGIRKHIDTENQTIA